MDSPTGVDTAPAPVPPDTLTPAERKAALDVARQLATLGIPIFVARPAPHTDTGFALPQAWQTTVADPAVVDTWRPGDALCAVMGQGIDLLDVDPRNDGDSSLAQLNGTMPRHYALASTPSGGQHYFITSLGVRSRNNTFAGIDVKAGDAQGEGRGFAFLAPTEKKSKVDGQSHPYRWFTPPDFAAIEAVRSGAAADTSGAGLAHKIISLLTSVPYGRPREYQPGPLGDWARQKEPQAQNAAERAINTKLADIRDWDPAGGSGGRQVVMRAALTLGGYVGGGYLDEDEARERLEDACAARWGSADEDDLRWIADGLRDGQRPGREFTVYTPEQERAWEAANRAAQERHDAELTRQAYAAQNGAATAQNGTTNGPAAPAQNGTVAPPQSYASAPEPAGGALPPGNAQNGSQTPGAGQAPPETATEDGQEPPFNIYRYIGTHPFDPDEDGSDQGLAQATAARMRPVLRYAADTGMWVQRGPERWVERKNLEPWAISEVAELMPLGRTPLPQSKADYEPEHWQAQRRAFFRGSAGAGRIGQKMRAVLSGGNHPSSVEIAKLDAEPHILWAGGMPWDLRASSEVPTLADLDPHTPHLHSARCAPQRVETPAWDAFLELVLPDPELRAFALRVLSVAFTGVPAEVLPFLHGRARSGKSSLVSLLVDVLGSYGIAANPKLLNANDSSHDAIIYQLKGARLAFIDEGPRNGFNATEKLKQLTGGAQQTASQKGANPITFNPTHTLCMTANEPPSLTDPAMMARFRLIPCDSDESAVRRARERLADPSVWRAEAPGVLAQMMAEAAAWLADRRSANMACAPDSLRVSVSELEAQQNPITEWVETVCVPAEPGTPSRELHRAYLAWHKQQLWLERVNAPHENAFGTKLTDLGYPSKNRKIEGKVIKYRSLSVKGGGGYAPPTPPSQGAITGVAASAPGSAATDSLPPVATEQKPCSSPLSSSSSSEVATYKVNTVTDTQITRMDYIEGGTESGIGVATSPVATSAKNSGSDLGGSRVAPLGSDSAPVPLPVTERSQTTIVPVDLRQHSGPSQSVTSEPPRGSEWVVWPTGLDRPAGLPEDFDLLANLTVKQKRTWAAARGCSVEEAGAELKGLKARAKAETKAAERAAKIAALSGPEYSLPVSVDRAGQITECSPENAAAAVRMLMKAAGGRLTVDVETTGYPVGHRLHELRTVQLGTDSACLIFDPAPHADTIRALLAEAGQLIAHSGQADVVPLAHAGLVDFERAMGVLDDTAVHARLADPKLTGNDGDLKHVGPTLLGEHSVTKAGEEGRKSLFAAAGWLTKTEHDTPIERSGWAGASKTGATMLRYAGADVLDTHAIDAALPPLPDWLTEREREFHRMTARITHRGVPLDADRIGELEAKHTPARAELGLRIRSFPGVRIENPGSPQQLVEAFTTLGETLPLTKPDRNGKGGGNPSTAEGALVSIQQEREGTAAGELARLVLDWREHNTSLNTFIGPYTELVRHGDGRARPTLYTVGADTGRTSCVRPNAQQLPRQGGFRAMYAADPGMVIVRADFSSVEIRGAGALSGDETLLNSIMISDERGSAAHMDIHWQVARMIKGEGATKEDRYAIKPGVFCHMYGGGVTTMAEQMRTSKARARQVKGALEALTPTYQAWSRDLVNRCKAGQNAFRSYSGRLIWIPRFEERKAPNYAVQGSCRELLVDAVVDRWRFTPWGRCTILPVHDELLAWVPAEDADAATRALVACMETTLVGPAGHSIRIKGDPDDPTEQNWPQDGRWHGFTHWADAS